MANSLLPNTPLLDPVTKDLSVAWRLYFDYLGSYLRIGDGSPEGVVKAAIGTVYHRRDGGAGTTFYVKEVGAPDTNTGWSAK